MKVVGVVTVLLTVLVTTSRCLQEPDHLSSRQDDEINADVDSDTAEEESTRHRRQAGANTLPAPTHVQATSDGPQAIRVEWQYGSTGGGIEFLVSVYREGSLVQDRVTRETNVRLVGLEADTTYDIKVRAFKALPGGRRANSPDTSLDSVSTKGVELAAPTSLELTDVTDTSVDVQWQYGSTGDGVEFLVVVYSEGSLVTDRVARETKVHIGGLAPVTTYEIRVRAFKALPRGRRANSPDSNTVSATTLAFAPQPQPPQPPPTQPPARPPTPPPAPPPTRPPTVVVFPTAPSVPGGDGTCSMQRMQGVAVHVLSCSLALHLRGTECGDGRRVPAQTVVIVDCWGVATMLLQCHYDGHWRPYGNNGNFDPPIRRLCQYPHINSPVCGRRVVHRGQQAIIHVRREPPFPWLAGIFLREKYSCTATILTPLYLLTAAHCLAGTQVSSSAVDLRDIRVQLLDADGNIHRQFVSRIDIWPGYVGGTRPKGDVALMRLEQHMTFSRHLHPACLSTSPRPYLSNAATFHRNHSDFEWDLVVQRSDTRCDSPSHPCARTLHLQEHQFCGTDVNGRTFLDVGSSGGPYLVNRGTDAKERWEVDGVVSSSHTHIHCPDSLTIFSSIQPFTDWLFRCIINGQC